MATMLRGNILGTALLISNEATVAFRVDIHQIGGHTRLNSGPGLEEACHLKVAFEASGIVPKEHVVLLAEKSNDSRWPKDTRRNLRIAIHISPLGCESDSCPHAPKRDCVSPEKRNEARKKLCDHVANKLLELFVNTGSVTEQNVIDLVTEYFIPPVSTTAS